MASKISKILKVTCPKCKKGHLRQHINVFVECGLGNRNVSKSGIRSDDVKILGAGWDKATVFCSKSGCGYFYRS